MLVSVFLVVYCRRYLPWFVVMFYTGYEWCSRMMLLLVCFSLISLRAVVTDLSSLWSVLHDSLCEASGDSTHSRNRSTNLRGMEVNSMLRFHPVRSSKKGHKSEWLFQAADEWTAAHVRQMASTNAVVEADQLWEYRMISCTVSFRVHELLLFNDAGCATTRVGYALSYGRGGQGSMSSSFIRHSLRTKEHWNRFLSDLLRVSPTILSPIALSTQHMSTSSLCWGLHLWSGTCFVKYNELRTSKAPIHYPQATILSRITVTRKHVQRNVSKKTADRSALKLSFRSGQWIWGRWVIQYIKHHTYALHNNCITQIDCP
jgi:hypothetical protein